MDATLVPIIQGLIAVTATLGGTWLGFQLSKGKEEQRWRRDRCLNAYAEILTLSAQVLERCEDLADPEYGPREPAKRDPEKRKRLWAKNVELALAHQKTVLLAPIAVRKPIDNLVSHCTQMVMSSTSPKPFAGQWSQMVAHHFKLIHRVERAIRPDLDSYPPLARPVGWRLVRGAVRSPMPLQCPSRPLQ
jgi:hypothetical protein